MFNSLFTLANMPIQRFGAILLSQGQFDGYLDRLLHAHRDENLDGVMCRNLLSVDYRGYVYDCDFNQMLDLPLTPAAASACICATFSTTISPTIRSVSPAIASAAPPARARAAAAR